MNVSYRWLRALLPSLDADPRAVADRLAMYGATVDELVPLGEGLADVLIARVQAVRPHPSADRLTLCDVDAGSGVVQVVCGAPNVRPDACYPFAPVGAALPGGVRIRRTRIRGEDSVGMLCSEAELGLGRDHSGILELRGEFEPGSRLVDALGLDDYRLVVDVTPNRPDLLCHVGIARELAPGGDTEIELASFPGGRSVAFDPVRVESEGSADGVRVEIRDPDLCPRYMAAVVWGVRIGPSPEWLAMRLRAVGARPINNVVDATNYVLYELGQPLHAFDLQRLGGPAIVVRRAVPGEMIVTLDGQKRTLAGEMLAICDAERPVAVAGIMGGAESEVTEQTTDVLIECALFEPKSVRATARSLGLTTDASYRFERGVDPEGLPAALRRVVELVAATAAGVPAPAPADVCPRPHSRTVIDLRPARVGHVLGIPFDDQTIRAQLEPLGFRVEAGASGALRVTVPGWRSYDVTREIDLVEEVARRYGYDRFPDEVRPFRPGTVPDDSGLQLQDEVRHALAAWGLLEARIPAFAPAQSGTVRLANPLSADEAYLRNALLPGLLRRVEHNFARGVRDVRLFEVGTVFHEGEPSGRPRERTNVAAVLTGRRAPAHWSGSAPLDIWDVKALVEHLLGPARLEGSEIVPGAAENALLEPDLAFTVRRGEEVAGTAGRVHPGALDAPAWADHVWAAELVLPLEPPPARIPAFTPLPAFPAVERDLAVIVPDAIPAAAAARVVRGAGGSVLDELDIFDVYRGAGIPGDARSLAFRLRFRALDRTLTDRDAQEVLDRIIARLKEELDVEPRGR